MKHFQMIAAVLILQTMAGCSGSSIAGPSGSNTASTPIAAPAPKPSIVSISPDTGSIYGGSWVTLVGALDRNAAVTIGGIRVSMGWSPTDSNKFSIFTPPHTAGGVDIAVTNAGGASPTVVGGYTYVDLGSADLDGAWQGVTVDGSDSLVDFTVRDQLLTSVRCSYWDNSEVTIEMSQPVVNGKAEFAGDTGRFSAWMASASETAGTINIAPCSGLRFVAQRRR